MILSITAAFTFVDPIDVWAQDAPELCNGIDDDEDGVVDEGFDVGAECQVASGACMTGGFKVCTADGTGTECEATEAVVDEEPEGPAGEPSCFDRVDNDCDGLTDHEDPPCQSEELCNGFDDDNDGAIDEDFTDLGDVCMVGVGLCQRSGVRVCSASGLTTTCSASPGPERVEGPPGDASCRDGSDNNCNGLVDLSDPACQEDEKCDGFDNDGDGDADEDFDIGAPCSAGEGICLANGQKVCMPDGSATMCTAMALAPQAEGPAGATCADGLDNDCDELVDLDDPNCGSSALAATCALPIVRGDRGASCAGWHEIQFAALNAVPGAEVTGEVLALDQSGAILGSLPVENGDLLHVISGLDAFDLRSQGDRHWVKAPIPMLRVTVRDGVREVRAYCSNLPFLDVVEPQGDLGSVVAQGDARHVTVALPNVDPTTLAVEVDGVDILAALGIDPSSDFPGGPFSGNVAIGASNVSVSDLIVESAPLALPSSNTLRMTLSGLGGGGHIVSVHGEARQGVISDPGSVHCLEDDLQDEVTIYSFEIQIDSPTAGELVPSFPVEVTGEVRHGRPIASLSINGLAQDVSGQVFTPGAGSAGTFALPFDAALEQTDLLADIQGLTTSLGTFDQGANRLVVEARDDLGNVVFSGHVFAVGNVLPMASLSSLTPLSTDGIEIQVHEGAEVADALVVGFIPSAVESILAQFCTQNEDTFEEFLEPALVNFVNDSEGSDTLPKEADVPFACDPTLDYEILSATFSAADELVCGAQFGDGILTVPLTLPDIFIEMRITGGCSTFLWHKVNVDRTVLVIVRDPSGSFDLSEEDFLMETIEPMINFELLPEQIEVSTIEDNTSVGGIGLTIVREAINALFDFVPGAETTFRFLSWLAGLGEDLFNAIFGSSEDPESIVFSLSLEIADFGLNGDAIASQMLGFSASLASVAINPEGLTASLTALIAPATVDPEIPEIPGVLETPATPPMPPLDMSEVFFAISDDVVNQILASLTGRGDFKSLCLPTGATVRDLLPADCTELGDPATNPLPIQVCEALKAPSCTDITDPSIRNLCVLIEQSLNITGETGVLVCGRLEVPPVLLIRDDFDPAGNPIDTPDRIETHVRLNDARAFVIFDRMADNQADQLGTLPSCIDFNGDVSKDCRLLETCLDLNVAASLALNTSGESPALDVEVGAVEKMERPPGYVCEGELPFVFVPDLIDRILASDSLSDLRFSIDLMTPLLQPEGLDLLGIGRLTQPRLKGIRTSEAMPGFDDYLGLLGEFETTP